MDNSSKSVGEGLWRIFTAFVRRPMGWSLIDAFTRLEEREEAVRASDETIELEPLHAPPHPRRNRCEPWWTLVRHAPALIKIAGRGSKEGTWSANSACVIEAIRQHVTSAASAARFPPLHSVSFGSDSEDSSVSAARATA
jgi:hypothetical protein